MFKELMASMDLSILPTIALLIFSSVFTGVMFWTHRKGSKELYDKVASEALKDGQLATSVMGVKQ